MLLLREKTATIKNITFFSDDSDENQFWYLPGDIHIAVRDGKPVFSLIKYTGDDANQQGGYINFEVNTAVDEGELNTAFTDYLNKLKIKPQNARKAPVPFNNGTVNFFVLDAQNANGQLISAQSSSLFGNNTAIFSAKLTPQQAVILEAAFNQAQAPAAVAYNLTYTGITPALKVDVTAEFDSVYKEFGAKFGINIPIPVETPASFWLGFDSVIKILEQDQKLVIKVTESMPSDEATKEKDWALQFVKEELLKMFFNATIKPNAESNEQAKSASASILESLIGSKDEKGKGGLFPCASLELKVVNITEHKTLSFNYTSSKAITQAAVPQNFIGTDTLKAKKEKPYFIEVNVNDPFFQKIELQIFGPDGFEEFGIKAAAFQASYNNNIYTSDAFTEDGKEWRKNIARSKDKNELFDLQGEFIFKSASSSGWEGNSSYQSKFKTASTTIGLDPNNLLTFNEIDIFLDRQFSWDKYNQVLVELTYLDDKGQKKTKKFSFNPDKTKAQTFKYRCLTEKPWTVHYTITYLEVGGHTRLVDGTDNPPAIVIPV